jgi:hypothetical protein
LHGQGLSFLLFFGETGLYFTYNADSLHPKSYKDTFKRKKNYIQVLARLSWSSSPPTVGTVALKPTTLPTTERQRFLVAPRVAHQNTNMRCNR